ncbi:MAG: ATP-binding cassette domain-containing protein [Thermodesulfovibrionales bacterium]|nr:ATP-binding cassette domain-containing protein [Thermodesulfovibrionales bacterium]
MEIIKALNLKKYFTYQKSILSPKGTIRAVDDVSFIIKPNRVFALVGESGCGKSTVARLVVRLIEPSEGSIYFKTKDIKELKGQEMMTFRKSVQIIFQDPFASLNPRMKISDILQEPLVVHKIGTNQQRKEMIAELLNKVGLSSDILNRYPHEFSGGQRQRICIARALCLSPQVIIADEPLSALDVSIQAQIINLFQTLRRDYNLSMLFISHDLNVVHYFSDEVAVMYLGKIVEQGETEILYKNPLHPYTNLLLSSAPKLNRKVVREKTTEVSEVPSPANVPNGCPFHPRCPKAIEVCQNQVPNMIDYKDRRIACHLYFN